MKNRNFKMVTAFMLLAVSIAWGLTRMNSVALWNSTVDNTVIGGTTPAAVHGTTIGATGAITAASVTATTLTTNSLDVNGLPTPSGANGFVGYGKNGTGDMDFFAANSGASPSFYWYYLLGSTVSVEMWLNQSAQLDVPNGIFSNSFQGPLTGNVVGNVTGNVTGNASTATTTTGNSATASAFNHTPGGCTPGGNVATSIAANGTLGCTVTQFAKTSSVSSTAATPYATADTTVPLNYLMGDTTYAVSCTLISPFGVPSIMGVVTKTTSSVTVRIVNGGTTGAEVVSGGSEMDCTVTGS